MKYQLVAEKFDGQITFPQRVLELMMKLLFFLITLTRRCKIIRWVLAAVGTE